MPSGKGPSVPVTGRALEKVGEGTGEHVEGELPRRLWRLSLRCGHSTTRKILRPKGTGPKRIKCEDCGAMGRRGVPAANPRQVAIPGCED